MSKMNMMSAKDKKKGPLVPRLRFPEFNGEWRSQPLGELAFIIKEKAGDRKCILMSIMSGVGLIPQIDKFGKEIAGQQYKNYIILHKNDFAYNKSSTKEYPEGFIAMYIGTEIAAVPNSIFTCFKIKVADIAHLYLNYLFLYNFHGKYLRRYITIGARSHGALAIDDADLLSLPIPYPTGNTSFKEQQRIADCLSSLDERIAAETNKLDALKAHKKGLLKQLFPAEGETLPALRFPKFRNAGEWKKADFGNIAKFLSGGTPSKDVCDYWGGDIPWISASSMHNIKIEKSDCNITKLAVSNGARIAPKGTLLLLVRGSMLHKRILLGISEIDVSFNQDVKALVLNDDITELYLMYFLMASESKLLATVVQTGIGAGKLDTDDLNNFPIMMPSPTEQQRISNCLSSLDELITAQTQKIDLLKEHKKGLMQQLFPRIDEVRA